MYWIELIIAIVLGSTALIVAACKHWRLPYIVICAIGCIGMPLGFSACIYDAATGKEAHKALLLIILFSLIVVIALICGRKLLSPSLYRMIFLFGCVYYVFISSGLFGHYYIETQGRFFSETQMDIFENYFQNRYGLWFPKFYLYWCYIRAGLPFFFELPKYELLTVVNITQFFIGKMVEICAIGTIARGITRAIMPVDKTGNKQVSKHEQKRHM